jgi:biopolymer transport protein TolR
MAFSSTQDEDSVVSDINITPLVDVMLVLLVSFVLTIPVLNNAVHVNLPKTVTTAPPQQQKTVTVTVDAAGVVYLDNEAIATESLGGRLEQLKAADSDLTLHLRADDHVPYGPVARVMATIEHAGVSRLAILTEQQ